MIKRTVEISREAAHVSLRHDQIVLRRGDIVVATIPSEDLGILVVDHPQTTFSAAALARIAEQGGVVVLCDRSHLPMSALIPYTRHTELVWRFQDQLDATVPIRKRLWGQIVAAKIHAQAELLDEKSRAFRKLKALAAAVKSGDSGANEAQAARIYWANWLTSHLPPEDRETRDHDFCPGTEPGYDRPWITPRLPVDTLRTAGYDDCPEAVIPDLGEPIGQLDEPLTEPDLHETARCFRRDPDGTGLNAFLNYGYAILRASTARAIVSAGLNPALGIQHANRSNPYGLADDIMEPLRPLVDRRVRHLWCEQGRRTLDPATKAYLLETLSETVRFEGQNGPLMVVLHRYVNSFLRCLKKTEPKIVFPKMIDFGAES